VLVRIDSQAGDGATPARGTRAEGADGEAATVSAMPDPLDEGSGQPSYAGVVDAWFFLGW
jgi:hypothetical protein